MSAFSRTLAGLLSLSAAHVFAVAAAEPTREQIDFFEGKIHPILAENCHKCHSIERGKSKGELTLDTKAGLEKGGENGKVIAPGNPEKSRLFIAISHTDPDLAMPPSSSGGKLGAQQIADIAAWIKMGAPYPQTDAKKAGSGKLSGLTDAARSHWAYQPVTKPVVPNNKHQQWCRTPVDSFILQKLEANGMQPSPDASRETLLRRVSYDLTGLPPTYAEAEDFSKDTSPDAFAKVVDRLLASPAYGERWGRHWLDTARYADTIGGPRKASKTIEYRYPDAWTYRDYVIRSFNEDKPYTDFITEQLAANSLPGIQPEDPRLAALGFLTVGERFRNVNDVINDRIDVVSKSFLAMTVVCARCHDHMFDPIPTRDYYALHGVFASITEPAEKPMIATGATEQQRQDFAAKYAAIMQDMRGRYFDAISRDLADFFRAPGAYIRAALMGEGKRAKGAPERKKFIAEFKLDEELVQFLSKEMQSNAAIWGPLMALSEGGNRKFARLSAMAADGTLEKLNAKMIERTAMKGGKIISERMKTTTNPLVAKAFADAPPKDFDTAVETYARLFAGLAPKMNALIPAMKNAASQDVPGFDAALIELLRGPFQIVPAPLANQEWLENAARDLPKKLANRVGLNFSGINLLETSHPGAPGHAMVVVDKATPVNSPIFIRGQALVKGDIVPRGFLEILSPGHKPIEFSEGSGRLELAKCIASRDNPLTARVIVNRVWMHHFGEGFVATSDDLGTMSEKPTHPELLDYLATWFMENGWSLKKLHKLIVLSRTYQQSCHRLPANEALDPGNRLLSRANLRRLDFEAMRDSLLVFSGALDRTLGGKPINLTEEPYSFRRSVYGYIDRGNLSDLMANFDFSDPDMPNSKRAITIVPQQALFLMNSPMAVDVARKILARPEVARQGSDTDRVTAIYRVIFQRTANSTEIRLALQFIQTEHARQEEAGGTLGPVAGAAGAANDGRVGANVKKRKDDRFGAIQNDGAAVIRKILSPWETYVHALLFSNEAAYMN